MTITIISRLSRISNFELHSKWYELLYTYIYFYIVCTTSLNSTWKFHVLSTGQNISFPQDIILQRKHISRVTALSSYLRYLKLIVNSSHLNYFKVLIEIETNATNVSTSQYLKDNYHDCFKFEKIQSRGSYHWQQVVVGSRFPSKRNRAQRTSPSGNGRIRERSRSWK